MSINDTDEWASMIINEVCDEVAKASDKVSKCTNSDDKEASEKSKLSKITDRENDLSLSTSADDKDYLTDLPDKFDPEWIESEEISNYCCEVSDEFKKDDIARFSTDQSIFTSAQNITPDCHLEPDVPLREVIEISEVACDPTEISMEEVLENYVVSASGSKSESLEKEEIIVDLDEAFIRDTEIDSRNADESGKNLEVSVLDEYIEGSSRSFSEISNDCPYNLDFLSFEDPNYGNKNQENTYPTMLDYKEKRDSMEKLHLCNNDSVSAELYGEKNCDFDPIKDENEFINDETSSASVDSEFNSESAQEYLRRIDEKIELVGFQKSPTKNYERNMKRSNSIADLYYEWFNENYVKEETEYRWGSDDGFVGREYLAANRKRVVNKFKSYSIGGNLNENVNEALISNGDRRDLNTEASCENFVCGPKSTDDMFTKRELEEVLEANTENMNGIFTENDFQWLDDVNGEEAFEPFSDEYSTHNITEYEKSILVGKNLDKSIFTCKHCKTKLENDDFYKAIEEIDDEEVGIRNRRIHFVLSTYRRMCSAWENIFIRPFANVFVDTCEFFIFVFFLGICLLCLLYERVQNFISNYKLRKREGSPSSADDENERVVLDTDLTMPQNTAAEVTGETASSVREENVAEVFPMEKNKMVILKDTNSLVEIEPEEVATVFMDYELVTEKVDDVCENILAFSCDREQHMAIVKPNEDCKVDFKVISANENEEKENDYDREIVASSDRFSFDADETDTQRDDDSYRLSQILEQREEDSELDLGTRSNSQNSLPEMSTEVSFRDENPLLNSTEVDGFENGAISEYKSCSFLNTFSDSDIIYPANDSSRTSPGISSEREFPNSSLEVNLSSFSSRSDILFDSNLIERQGLHGDQSTEYADDIKSLNEIKAEDLCTPSLNPGMSLTESFQDVSMTDSKVDLTAEGYEGKSSESYFDEKLSWEPLRSEVFQISSAADVEFRNALEGSLMCGDAKFISKLSNPSEGSSSSEPHDVFHLSTVDKKLKSNRNGKHGLRRRMSLILNNWRNVQVMPCIMKNPKHRKSCCKANYLNQE